MMSAVKVVTPYQSKIEFLKRAVNANVDIAKSKTLKNGNISRAMVENGKLRPAR